MRKLLNISMIAVVAVCFVGSIYPMEQKAKWRKRNEFWPIKIRDELKIFYLVGSLNQVVGPFSNIVQTDDYEILIRKNFDKVLTEVSQGQLARKITNLYIQCFDSRDFIYSSLRKLSNLNNLCSLSLVGTRDNQFTIKLVSCLTTLQELDLRDNDLSSEVVEGLCKLRSLRYLNLSKNQIEYLPEKVSKLSDLEVLDLQDNRLNYEAVQHIHSLPKLWILRL